MVDLQICGYGWWLQDYDGGWVAGYYRLWLVVSWVVMVGCRGCWLCYGGWVI